MLGLPCAAGPNVVRTMSYSSRLLRLVAVCCGAWLVSCTGLPDGGFPHADRANGGTPPSDAVTSVADDEALGEFERGGPVSALFEDIALDGSEADGAPGERRTSDPRRNDNAPRASTPRGAESWAAREPEGPIVEVIRTDAASDTGTTARRDDPGDAGGSDEDRLARLLSELRRFRGRAEEGLADGERLAKHRIASQLIGIHFTRARGSVDHIEPLLDAIADPHYAGTSYLLLRAAFYHDVGREDLRDRALATLRPGSGSRPRLRVENLQTCSRIGGFRDYTALPSKTFLKDQQIWIYAELLDLTSERVGDMWRHGVRITADLHPLAGGPAVDRRLLTSNEGVWEDAEAPPTENHICCSYRFPMRIASGDYRLVVTVHDLNAGIADKQEMEIEIR